MPEKKLRQSAIQEAKNALKAALAALDAYSV